MERTILPGLQQAVGTGGGYGVSGGGPITVLTEAGSGSTGGTGAFLPATSVSGPTVTEPQETAYTSVEGMERKDGSIGTVKIPSLGINMKVWEGETDASMKKVWDTMLLHPPGMVMSESVVTTEAANTRLAASKIWRKGIPSPTPPSMAPGRMRSQW